MRSMGRRVDCNGIMRIGNGANPRGFMNVSENMQSKITKIL